jgi:AGZA family xanthine/uracil permease-like MFS transporter
VAVVLGTAIAWTVGVAPVGPRPESAALSLPIPALAPLWSAFTSGHLVTYLSVIVPMGLFNVIGSLQNIESSEAAGDAYPTRSSLVVNGVGSLVAALFGSTFPTTIYIGHPGWKALGARAGYSVLNGAFVTIICLTGTLSFVTWAVPVEAGMAIVLWIGIVISAQAFQATPRAHAPAVVMGILPGIGAWGAMMAKAGLHAAGVGEPGGPPFTPALVAAFQRSDTWIHGAFALEQGFIFTAMVLAATTVHVIERRFARAALWCTAGAVLSGLGLMHSYQFTPGDTVLLLAPAWPWAIGYGVLALLFLCARWITEPGEDHGATSGGEDDPPGAGALSG